MPSLRDSSERVSRGGFFFLMKVLPPAVSRGAMKPTRGLLAKCLHGSQRKCMHGFRFKPMHAFLLGSYKTSGGILLCLSCWTVLGKVRDGYGAICLFRLSTQLNDRRPQRSILYGDGRWDASLEAINEVCIHHVVHYILNSLCLPFFDPTIHRGGS